MKKKKKGSGKTLHSLAILLLLVFVAATEFGYTPGQKLLEFACSLVTLALGGGNASAAITAENHALAVTKRSKVDFEATYGRYKVVSTAPKSVSSEPSGEVTGLKERSALEATAQAATASQGAASSRTSEDVPSGFALQ